MEQLTQNLKDGTMQLLEVPFPALSPGCVLVRNHFSVISAGTEGKTVKDARMGYIGKARARKQEVRKVVETAKTLGIRKTWSMVMNKLDAPSPLGYSCAGQIMAIASDVRDLVVGDLVACGGSGAVHAEVVAVPQHLCTKIDPSVSLQHAAFTTMGAIALQGVRQAALQLGENCVVIGLGLIGQLTVQLLRASGIRVIGIDLDPKMTSLAKRSGCQLSLLRNRTDLEEQVNAFTDGYGADAVIITAGSTSTDPVDLAGLLARKKGKVIIVGAVPTGFQRSAYFKKELDLKMSSSYGPGRYDPEYEELGIDYPYAYVRWTENRNMQAFASLLESGTLRMEHLVSHVFPFRDAALAYQMIVDRTESFSGIVLKYDTERELKASLKLKDAVVTPGQPAIALIGAGSFGQNFLLPALKGHASMIAVMTSRPHSARNIADKYGFAICTADASEIFGNTSVNTIFIATRHDSHAQYVIEGLRAGKNVFTEKPLCLKEEELPAIQDAYEKSGKLLMVGFNRRFAPFITVIKERFSQSTVMAIQYRINAGQMPADHWIHSPETGGGRIVGELCHFIDLCLFITGSPVVAVTARVMKDPRGLNDTLNVLLGFANGSTAAVSYFSNGNKQVSKERLEIYADGTVAEIDDFAALSIYGKKKEIITGTQDKGHTNEVKAFLESVRSGTAAPIPVNDIFQSTLVTFKILDSIALNGETIRFPSL